MDEQWRDCLKRKSSGVYQNFQQIDIKLYQAYRSRKELTKIQKKISTVSVDLVFDLVSEIRQLIG